MNRSTTRSTKPALLLAFCSVSTAWAQTPPAATAPVPKGDPPPLGFASEIVLWPAGAPLAKGTARADIPKLYVYPATGPGVHSAVIVLPGGGFTHLVMDKEGGEEARWLAAHGVTAFVLEYRLSPAYRFPAPMLDGQRAIRYVRSHAADFAADPDKIGVWGFSAGGTTAGYLATASETAAADGLAADPIDRVSARPDFAIFNYARLSMDASIPRTGNQEALLGDNPTPAMLDQVSAVQHVTRATPPSFLYSTTGDQTVNSLNATAFYDALKRAGVPAELHIFELGQHGTHMGLGVKNLPELEVFPLLLEHWMQLHGWMTASDPEK